MYCPSFGSRIRLCGNVIRYLEKNTDCDHELLSQERKLNEPGEELEPARTVLVVCWSEYVQPWGVWTKTHERLDPSGWRNLFFNVHIRAGTQYIRSDLWIRYGSICRILIEETSPFSLMHSRVDRGNLWSLILSGAFYLLVVFFGLILEFFT